MDNEALLMTVPEAAKLLRIGRNHAYELVATGEIPAIRLGRTIRVPRHALEQWLEARAWGGSQSRIDSLTGSATIRPTQPRLPGD